MNRQLEGKRALVTGGSRGIGAAIIERLAREGADVALRLFLPWWQKRSPEGVSQ